MGSQLRPLRTPENPLGVPPGFIGVAVAPDMEYLIGGDETIAGIAELIHYDQRQRGVRANIEVMFYFNPGCAPKR